MKTPTLSLMTAVWLGVVMIPLAGCNNPDSAVHAERDAQGNTQVHVNGPKVDQNVNQANKDFRAAGEQIKAGANQAGAALQRGADKVQTQVQTRVVPAAKEMFNDASITAKVKTQLAGDPAINALYVNVDTSNGKVTLTGKVAMAEQKAQAEKVARAVSGVTDVVNQLEVTGQAPPQK